MSGLVGRLAAFGLLLPFAGLMLRSAPGYVPGQSRWAWLLVAGLVLLGVAVMRLRQRRGGSSGVVDRWSRKSRRNGGVASTWAIIRHGSFLPVRWKAKVLRPSLRQLGWWGRLAVPTRAYATPLARVGWLRVWSACEDVTLRVGGPRTGKTGELAGRILDAPGAVIVTSTRTDVIDLTAPLRRKLGSVRVFNPSGLGGLASTIVFDPLSGCADPAVAEYRAGDLVAGGSAPGGDGGERAYWSTQARMALAGLMHAAALGGAGMRDVLAWVANPDAGADDVRRYLRRSPGSAFGEFAEQFLTNNDRTRSSICSTIMPALAWLTNPTAAAAAGVDAQTTTGGFDVPALLEQNGTVFLLGAEDAQTAPLLCALVGHIARDARKTAGLSPAGRLDPPLTLALDEAALICPVPLDNWTADMGGRGVTIHIAVQSRAQLRQRWGDNGAAAILNNSATLLIYGAGKDGDDLGGYATLIGERDEEVATYDAQGNLTGISHRRVPVLSPALLAQLPFRRVVIIRRGMAPAVGKVQMAWKRGDVRRANLAITWTPRLQLIATASRQLARWGAARTRQTAGWTATQPHLTEPAPATGDMPARAVPEEGTADAA